MEIHTSQINSSDFPQKKTKRIYLYIGLLIVTFFIGWQVGHGNIDTSGGSALGLFVDKNRDNAPQDLDWNLLWNAIDKIQQEYVNRPADMQQVLYGAVSGAVASLGDPYSMFFPPQEAQSFQDELAGNLEGIGAEVALKNELLTVVSPIDGAPAQKAGIRAGDYIQKIDGEDSSGLSLDDAVNKIRGDQGSQVTLTVYHKGDTKSTEIKITRAKIVVQSVTSEIKEVNDKRIGYIKMRRFGEDTTSAIDGIVSDFLVKNVQGIVVDVRNNPGGYLQTAVEVAGNWVKNGDVVVSQRYGDGTEEVYRSDGKARLQDIPTVVLINGGSASASEILSGALHDHGLATLVGEQSFGKGSVQELIDLKNGAELKLTIAKWLTPDGFDLNKEGLAPDDKVELSEDDFNNDRDPQLDKALEILGQQ